MTAATASGRRAGSTNERSWPNSGTYNGLGVISGTPDTATVDVIDGTVSVVETIPHGAWDPDPLPE